ncbi:MAG: radical SAM protein [Rhodospirillales bacterium]|nr:radical SAM protein [Rhodospirillales bacterium]MBO6787720.1 radical SAM protein [Rhodospirillales bacterium]
MSAEQTAIDLRIPDPAGVREAVDAKISGFDFEGEVVLIQVPQFPLDMLESSTARGRGYFAYPPQNLLYLSAIFRELGLTTRIVDLNYAVLRAALDGDDPEQAWQALADEAFADDSSPLICMSLMFDSTSSSFDKVLNYVRKLRPQSCIMAGGVAATAEPEKLLYDGVDFVFSHEGESALDRFYAYVRGQSDQLPINLSLLDAGGNFVQTNQEQGSPVEFDIRSEYKKIPIKRYHEVGCLSNFSRMIGTDVPYATIISRRGCRARCSFCGVRNFNGKGVRVRSTGDVIAEMRHLYDNYDIRHFDWLDDDLLYDRDGIVELFHAMAENLPEATWAANNGVIAAAVTPEILEAMQASRCIGFKIGLESGNPNVLKDVHKPTNLKKFFEFSDLARDYPTMYMAVNFIMGFPGEQVSQMMDSFSAAVRGNLDWNNFYLYQHLKNTELFIAHGSMGGGDAEDKARTNSQPMSSLNPVRGGMFRNDDEKTNVLSGYDVIEYAGDHTPTREQLKEIWFTFNFVANFLNTPAIDTDQEERLRNGIQWLEALSRSYPDDPSMTALLYYLHARLGELSKEELAGLQKRSRDAFRASDYWQRRDAEFSISALLENTVPDIDSRWHDYMKFTALDR